MSEVTLRCACGRTHSVRSEAVAMVRLVCSNCRTRFA